MPENITWAKPEKTECWSFHGRLYQTRPKVMVEKRHHDERLRSYRALHGRGGWYDQAHCDCKVYKVTWIWEEESE